MADTLLSLKNNQSVVITGTDRNDTLYGSTGHTIFYGGLGNDTYYSKNAGDTIIERENEGRDLIYSSTDFTLPEHVEDLKLQGNSMLGIGNDADNVISGNSNGNRLYAAPTSPMPNKLIGPAESSRKRNTTPGPSNSTGK